MTFNFFRSRLPILLATLLAPLAITIAAQSDGWNGIIPSVSDRDEVEKILGPCPSDSLHYCLYKTETENIHVSFSSTDGCPGSTVASSPGSVLMVAVFPNDGRKLTDLDLKEFVSEADPEIAGVLQHSNQRGGVTVESKGGMSSGFTIRCLKQCTRASSAIRPGRQTCIGKKIGLITGPRWWS